MSYISASHFVNLTPTPLATQMVSLVKKVKYKRGNGIYIFFLPHTSIQMLLRNWVFPIQSNIFLVI